MKRILLTGSNGFVGHHVLEHFLKNTDWEFVCIDKLSYASSGFDRINDIDIMKDEQYRKRVSFFPVDLCLPFTPGLLKEIGKIDIILHIAAESHVDNSITDPVPFVQNNVNSTLFLLEYARTVKDLELFLYFSTDEVYGTIASGAFAEGDRFNSGNPYSASKACGECLCRAYSNTYRIPTVITNTMNVLGERQHPEKFVPKTIKTVLQGGTMTIHSDPSRTKAGSRFYIHARNVADALLFLLLNNKERIDKNDASIGKFHIVGEKEIDNLTLAKMVASVIGLPLKYEMVDFHSSRPGHDLRYALDGSKMLGLGWRHPIDFDSSLSKAIKWTLREDKLRWLDI